MILPISLLYSEWVFNPFAAWGRKTSECNRLVPFLLKAPFFDEKYYTPPR